MSTREKINTVDLSKFKSDPIISAKNQRIRRVLWFFANALFLQSNFIPFSSLKILLLRLFGAKIGKGVIIKPSIYIKYPWRLEIGDYVWIGEKVWIANESLVKIGNNVCISHGVLLICGGHNYKKRYFDVYNYPITIEDGVWLGAQSCVIGGVRVKSHAVLAIKSVANFDLEPYTIYRGNPAVEVRKRIIED